MSRRRARSAERPGLRQEQRLPGQRRRGQPGIRLPLHDLAAGRRLHQHRIRQRRRPLLRRQRGHPPQLPESPAAQPPAPRPPELHVRLEAPLGARGRGPVVPGRRPDTGRRMETRLFGAAHNGVAAASAVVVGAGVSVGATVGTGVSVARGYRSARAWPMVQHTSGPRSEPRSVPPAAGTSSGSTRCRPRHRRTRC